MENIFLEMAAKETSRELAGLSVERVSGVPPLSLTVEFAGKEDTSGAEGTSRAKRLPHASLLLICLDHHLPCITTLERPVPDAPAGEHPEGFVRVLSESIRGTVLHSVEQHGRDRVARIVFARKPGAADSVLWLEFFGRKPLAILVNASSNTVLACSNEGARSGSGRVVHVGGKYSPPENLNKIDVKTLSTRPLQTWMKESQGAELAARLSRRIEGLSPQVALQLLYEVSARQAVKGIRAKQGLADSHPPSAEDLHTVDLRVPDRLLESLRQHLLQPDKYFRPFTRTKCAVPGQVRGEGPRFDVTLFPFGPATEERLPHVRSQDFRTALAALRCAFQDLCAWYRMLASARLRASASAIQERLERLRQALGADMDAAERADDYAIMGELILANLRSIPRSAEKVRVADLHGGGKAPVTIELDPALSPTGNANRYFKMARKAKRAREILSRRLAEVARNIQTVEEFSGRIPPEVDSREASSLNQRLDTLRKKVTPGGVRAGALQQQSTTDDRRRRGDSFTPGARKPRRQAAVERFNPRLFTTSDGHSVLVGRNNAENDYLTHRLAKPEDLWFHAHRVSGSHVILKGKGKSAPSKRAIQEAAAIAAYFSKGRTSSSVPVIYTQKKFVHRPRGTRPGTATFAREKLIMARPVRPGVRSGDSPR